MWLPHHSDPNSNVTSSKRSCQPRPDAWGWCTGMTQRDGMGREEGGGFSMGNTCIPVADSFRYLAKLIQFVKFKNKIKLKKKRSVDIKRRNNSWSVTLKQQPECFRMLWKLWCMCLCAQMSTYMYGECACVGVVSTETIITCESLSVFGYKCDPKKLGCFTAIHSQLCRFNSMIQM